MPTTKTDKPAQQYSEKPTPRSAFRCSLAQFKAGDNADGLTPFEMLARSNKPVKHWLWGDIYHDFDGMQVAESIPVDYCHNENDILGYADSFQAGPEGLTIQGALVHQHEGDRVDQVTHKAAAGVPYQASIDFRGDDNIAEEVREGFTAQVNGQTITGPALIFRQWTLNAMAICPLGKDKNTRTQFSEDDAESCVLRIFTEEPMTKTKTGKPEGEKPEEQQSDSSSATESGGTGSPAENSGDSKPAEQQSETDGETVAQFKERLKSFTAKFGAENGVKWFDEGLTYTQALERHQEQLTQQLSEKDQQLSKAQETLQALKGGEDVPAQQSETDGEETDAGKFAYLGRGKGAFADRLRLKK